MATAFSNADRAEVLTQALPYFKKYYGKTVVVKYGGNAMLTEDLQQQVMEDIVSSCTSWVSAWCSCTAAARKSPAC